MSVLVGMLQDLDRRGTAPEVSAAVAAAIEAPVSSGHDDADRRAAKVRFGLLAAGLAILLLGGAAFWWVRGSHAVSTNGPALASMPAAVPYPPAPPPVVTPAANSSAPTAKHPIASAPAQTAALLAVTVPQKTSHKSAAGVPDATHMPLLASLADREHASATAEAAPAGGVVPHVGTASDAAADLARAYELAGRGRNTEAIEILRRTVHAWPAHAEGRLALATLLGETGQVDEQMKVLLDGAALDPLHFALVAARMQAQRGAAVAALETLDRLPVEQRNADFHGFTAAIAQRAARHDVAVREYRLALALEPGRALWWVGLGASLEQLQQPADALLAYRQAQVVGGASAASAEFAARRLVALGDTPAARAQAAAAASATVAAGH